MSSEHILDRRRFLGTALMALGGSRLGLFGMVGEPLSCAARDSSGGRELPTFDGASEWLNTQPLTPAGLRGKVVLVQFWTYTCINWLRTEPYTRAWAERYKAQGLTVIGVHSPEFTFERELPNVRRAVKDMEINYPVAVDSDHTIWRAFENAYWPALYLADATGVIRYQHFGEGRYDESERMIQRLLAKAGNTGVDDRLVTVVGRGAEAPADWSSLGSEESYVGYDRARNFASPQGAVYAERRAYTFPSQIDRNHWALAGDWTMRREGTALNAAPGRIAYRFHARDVHLVMGSADQAPVRFNVRIDGRAPGAAHGVDAGANGDGVVREPRLYQLIRQPGAVSDRLFEMEFLDPGAEAFVFTFG